MRDADVHARFLDDPLDLVRMRAAAVAVDVRPVRLVVEDLQVRTELAQNAGRRFVGGAVRDIDGDAHFLERHAARETRLGELNVAPERIVDAGGAADLPRGRANGIDVAAEDELLDLIFDAIVELVAIVAEELDAVVFVGVMRRGENDAGVGAE